MSETEMKIYHVADIHLGRRRIEGRLPDQDLADAFGHIANSAIEDHADMFIIAGDLFDRPQVEPPHLGQALTILRRLKKAKIPVIAVEGNHDKAFVHSDHPTWVHHLSREDLLILLQPRFDSEGAILEEWNAKTKKGAWIEMGGIRFVGAGYLGAATQNKVRQIISEMDDETTNIMILHAGPDYFVGQGGFSSDELKEIQTKACYLALGHIHKPMLHNGWACNPGSPENCNLNEARYDFDQNGKDQKRGFAVIEVDPELETPLVSVEICSNPRRPCHLFKLDCTPFKKTSSAFFVEAAHRSIASLEPEPEAIVDLKLIGKIDLNQINLTSAASEIAEKSNVFIVAIDTTGLNIEMIDDAERHLDEGKSREEMEHLALNELLEDEGLWGLQAHCETFVNLFYNLKESVQNEHSAEELAEQITANPLIELVARSKMKSERQGEKGMQ